ncbi:MAG: hypothetical protein GY901_08530, partial [Actinomycetia bacterium]|nr:hypothetical protein [Actinomycetes bacterium]
MTTRPSPTLTLALITGLVVGLIATLALGTYGLGIGVLCLIVAGWLGVATDRRSAVRLLQL